MKSSRTWQTGIESGSLMVNEQLETELTLEGDSQYVLFNRVVLPQVVAAPFSKKRQTENQFQTF